VYWIYYEVSRGHYRFLSKNFKNDTNIKFNILNSAAGTFGKLALYIDEYWLYLTGSTALIRPYVKTAT
jgi:hypothetical protein